MTSRALAPPRARARLAAASAAVLLGAADTYVVVLALPSMMADLGLSLNHLEKAAPIVSGFLLGYVALLPLLGRLSDHHGRGPVLAGCLATFAFGSLVTASSHDLVGAVVGRTIQGAGGGGLVPVTLALVADLWPPGRRGLPFGVVGAVQELGSVVGPLYGAALLTAAGWRSIFWVNLPLAALLGLALLLTRGARTAPSPRRHLDPVGIPLAAIAIAAAALALAAPPVLTNDFTWGVLYAPLAGGSALTTPLALIAFAATAGLLLWGLLAPDTRRPLLPLRRLPGGFAADDGTGALLVATVLGCIVVSFAGAESSRELVSPASAYLLPIAAVALVALIVWERRHRAPLLPLRSLTDRAASGALLTNLLVGGALIAALVDIPLYARTTVAPSSQLDAAMVLLRFLVGVPVGALLGGAICERIGYRVTAAAGLALATAMFAVMSRWDAHALDAGIPSFGTVALLAGGLGVGLAIAPVQSALIGAVRASLHGLASALAVVARMVGMLVGISVLTAIGLRVFYASAGRLPEPSALCPTSPLSCPAYDELARAAVLDELHAIFVGAAVCAALAAAVAAITLRRHVPGTIAPS